tara:strand:- start:311 stop:580 length:270 start_codon:yes stop_codon:yes gene_type:complete
MIETIMTLSTEHMPNCSPDFGGFRALRHEHGFVVFCFELEGMEDLDVPVWLKPIMKEANTKGCVLVLFDGDADRADFTVYEWGLQNERP